MATTAAQRSAYQNRPTPKKAIYLIGKPPPEPLPPPVRHPRVGHPLGGARRPREQDRARVSGAPAVRVGVEVARRQEDFRLSLVFLGDAARRQDD